MLTLIRFLQKEKNLILEKFAIIDESNTTSKVAWIRGLKRTFGVSIDDHSEGLQAPPAAGVDARCTSVASETFDAVRNQTANNSSGPPNDLDVENLQLDNVTNDAMSVSSDKQTQEGESRVDCGVDTRFSSAASKDWDDSDGQDFEPLVSLQTTESSDVVFEIENWNRAAVDREDDNMWLKVGGGLAMLGAVMGGVALIAAQNGGEGNRDRRRQAGNDNSGASS